MTQYDSGLSVVEFNAGGHTDAVWGRDAESQRVVSTVYSLLQAAVRIRQKYSTDSEALAVVRIRPPLLRGPSREEGDGVGYDQKAVQSPSGSVPRRHPSQAGRGRVAVAVIDKGYSVGLQKRANAFRKKLGIDAVVDKKHCGLSSVRVVGCATE